MDRGRNWRAAGYALSAVGAMMFACKGIYIKLAYEQGVEVLSLLAIRMLLSMPVFALVGVNAWRRTPVGKRTGIATLAGAAAVGCIGYHLSSWLDFEGLARIDAQSERLILFTYPFLVLLFGKLLFGRPLSVHAVAGALISYAGIAVMFGGAPQRLTSEALTGGGLVFCAAISFAFYQLFAQSLIARCGPALFTAVAMIGAAVTLLTQFVLTHPLSALAIAPAAWPPVLMLTVLATVLPAFLMSAGTARVGAQGTAIISTLSPLVTILLAVAVLGEPFGWPEAMGALLTLAGVGLFAWIDTRRGAAQPPPEPEIASAEPIAASAPSR